MSQERQKLKGVLGAMGRVRSKRRSQNEEPEVVKIPVEPVQVVDESMLQEIRNLNESPLLKEQLQPNQSQDNKTGSHDFVGQYRSEGHIGEGRKDLKPKQTQRERDWADFFQFRFGPLVIMILWMFVQDLEKATFYAPTVEECKELAPHASRLAVKLEDMLNAPKWVHNIATSTDDVVSIGMLVLGYLDRIGVLTKMKPMFFGGNNEQSTGPSPKVPGTNGSGRPEDYDISQLPIGAQYFAP